MKIWITKYALTHGIICADGELCLDTDPTGNMVKVSVWNALRTIYYHRKGKDWTDSFESAVTIAEKLRDQKIKQYEKSLDKLKNLEISVKDAKQVWK